MVVSRFAFRAKRGLVGLFKNVGKRSDGFAGGGGFFNRRSDFQRGFAFSVFGFAGGENEGFWPQLGTENGQGLCHIVCQNGFDPHGCL
mgnify:CR=1 FL=1